MPYSKSSSSEFADPAMDNSFCLSYSRLVSWCHRHVDRSLGDDIAKMEREMESLERDLTHAERTVCLGLLAGRSEAQLVGELRITRGALAVRASRARQTLLRTLELGTRIRRR